MKGFAWGTRETFSSGWKDEGGICQKLAHEEGGKEARKRPLLRSLRQGAAPTSPSRGPSPPRSAHERPFRPCLSRQGCAGAHDAINIKGAWNGE